MSAHETDVKRGKMHILDKYGVEYAYIRIVRRLISSICIKVCLFNIK